GSILVDPQYGNGIDSAGANGGSRARNERHDAYFFNTCNKLLNASVQTIDRVDGGGSAKGAAASMKSVLSVTSIQVLPSSDRSSSSPVSMARTCRPCSAARPRTTAVRSR